MSSGGGLVALVTGGSGDIGRAICRRLAADGMTVVVHCFSGVDRAGALVDALCRDGSRASTLQADLRNSASADALVAATLERCGRLDVLVNNAGVSCRSLLLETSDADLHAVVAANFFSAVYVTRAALPALLGSPHGTVVNVSSLAAGRPMRGNSIYAASKAALEGFTRAMAAEVGKSRVRVNAVAPGVVRARMAADLTQRQDGLLAGALRQFADPEDVAAAVSFLASNDARRMTGQLLAVDGGHNFLSVTQ